MEGLLTVRLKDIDRSLRRSLKEVPGLRVSGVELDAVGAGLFSPDFGRTAERDLAHRLEASGAKLAVIRYDSGRRRFADPKLVDEAFAGALRCLRYSAVFKAVRFVAHTGCPAKNTQADFFAETLRDLAAKACAAGVSLCFDGGLPAETRLEFLEHASMTSVLLELDPLVELGAGMEPAVSLVKQGDRCGMVLLRDGYRGGGSSPFGEGDVPWNELAVLLETAGPNLPLVVVPYSYPGMKRRECVEKSLEAVRGLSPEDTGAVSPGGIILPV